MGGEGNKVFKMTHYRLQKLRTFFSGVKSMYFPDFLDFSAQVLDLFIIFYFLFLLEKYYRWCARTCARTNGELHALVYIMDMSTLYLGAALYGRFTLKRDVAV